MIQKIEGREVKTIYGNLLDGLGFYRHRPGKAPYICLDNSLLEDDRNGWKHQAVYDVLLEYHRSLPLDSIYRSFVIVKYYEDLVPAPEPAEVAVEVPETKEPQPEIIIIGRAIRVWRFMQDGDKVRIIGKAAS
jgi:hypothetical protein